MDNWIIVNELARIADALEALAMKNACKQFEDIKEQRIKEENWDSY